MRKILVLMAALIGVFFAGSSPVAQADCANPVAFRVCVNFDGVAGCDDLQGDVGLPGAVVKLKLINDGQKEKIELITNHEGYAISSTALTCGFYKVRIEDEDGKDLKVRDVIEVGELGDFYWEYAIKPTKKMLK